MKIVSAMVLTGQGPDYVFLQTDLPPAMANQPGVPLSLKFETTKGTGADYVRQNFSLEPEIINRGGNLRPKFRG